MTTEQISQILLGLISKSKNLIPCRWRFCRSKTIQQKINEDGILMHDDKAYCGPCYQQSGMYYALRKMKYNMGLCDTCNKQFKNAFGKTEFPKTRVSFATTRIRPWS